MRDSELDFAEIDLRNPFSITESTLSPKVKSSNSSFNDSLPYPNDAEHESADKLANNRKSNRGRKLDNFDYSAKIQEELQKMGDIPDEASKKKIIQKIRNRISANRSRLRLKSSVDYLQDENDSLRHIIRDLEEQLKAVKGENQELKQKLFHAGCISPPVTPQAEPVEYTRSNAKFNKSYAKNMFFIAAIVALVTMFGTETVHRVKMGGAVPLLSFNAPKTKSKAVNLSEICKKAKKTSDSCTSNKKYLYKLKQKINKRIASMTEFRKLLPQYKIKDFMTEIVSYNCKSMDSDGVLTEKVFLFDKEVAEEANKTKESLYISETWPVEFIEN